MRFGPFFALLFLSLCQCNGSPTGRSRIPYNDEERKLIFEELLKPSCKTLNGAKTWEAIRQEHDQRRIIDNLREFQHERTPASLRYHVFDLRHRGLLPDEIVKKFRIQQKAAMKEAPYHLEEKKLIFEELLKPSCKSLCGPSTLEAIRAEHDRRRLVEKLPEFQNERTQNSLRAQIMRLRGQYPDEILKKYGKQQKGDSSSNPPIQQIDLEVDDMIDELLNNTDYEIDFSKVDSTG